MGAGPAPWRRPLALAGIMEVACLLYYHVCWSFPHSVAILSWLPFGNWKVTGPMAGPALYAACITIMFVAYGLLLRDLSRRPAQPRDAAILFGTTFLFGVTLLLLPALLSKDLFDYIGHGRVLAVHGANLFTTPASAFPPDRFTEAMGWPAATPLYGPAWGSLCAALALLGGGSFLGTVMVFKAFLLAAHLVNGVLIMGIVRRWRDIPGRPLKPIRAAAFYLWNPLVLTQTPGDAHNDVVVLFFVLLGVWLLQRHDELMGAAGLAMSVLIKYVTAPLVFLIAIHQYRSSGIRKAATLVGACVVLAVLAYAPYLSGFHAGHFLRPYEHSSYQGGLMMLLEIALSSLLGTERGPGTPVGGGMLVFTVIAAIGLGAWLLGACVRSTRTLPDTVEAGTRLLFYYLLFVTALLRVSYVVWIVGLAAVVASVTLRRAIALFSATVLALEVYWIHRIALEPVSPDVKVRFAATAVAVGVPILYLLLRHRRGPWGARSRLEGAG